MTTLAIQSWSRSTAAFALAAGVHVGLGFGLLSMPAMEITPPQAVGGFEVVDLSAFGIAAAPEPEPVIEKPAPEPEPEALPEPEPEPEIAEPEPEPLPVPVPEQPKPKPKPVAKPKPEPKPEPKPQPKPIEQVQKPAPKPKPVATPQTATAGSQNAFVPPSSTAAYLRNPKPAYPALAQRRGMQGVVLLLVEVSAKGEPLAVKLKSGSGYSILDKAALRAVQKWRFAPATRGGRPIAAQIEVPIRFTLNDA